MPEANSSSSRVCFGELTEHRRPLLPAEFSLVVSSLRIDDHRRFFADSRPRSEIKRAIYTDRQRTTLYLSQIATVLSVPSARSDSPVDRQLCFVIFFVAL